MRLHIEGKDTTIVPHLMGRIADRLEQLNEVHDDILEARLTLVRQGHQHEAHVRLVLAGKTLYAMQHGNSPDAAIGAALRRVEDDLSTHRALCRHRHTAMHAPQNPSPPRSSPFIGGRPTAQPRRVPLRRTTAKRTVS
jgi:ribosome-associated translation inhibitor RaiA